MKNAPQRQPESESSLDRVMRLIDRGSTFTGENLITQKSSLANDNAKHLKVSSKGEMKSVPVVASASNNTNDATVYSTTIREAHSHFQARGVVMTELSSEDVKLMRSTFGKSFSVSEMGSSSKDGERQFKGKVFTHIDPTGEYEHKIKTGMAAVGETLSAPGIATAGLGRGILNSAMDAGPMGLGLAASSLPFIAAGSVVAVAGMAVAKAGDAFDFAKDLFNGNERDVLKKHAQSVFEQGPDAKGSFSPIIDPKIESLNIVIEEPVRGLSSANGIMGKLVPKEPAKTQRLGL
jgi:hypothetical protein